MSTNDRPRCYNRPTRPLGSWIPVRSATGKATFRYVYFRMSIDCGSHKTFGGLQEVDPIRYKWNCDGCRWHPSATPPAFYDHATGGYRDS